MKRLRLIAPLLVIAAILVATVPAFAAKPDAANLLATNWRVYNIMPATSSLWDINKAQYDDGVLSFPIQQFESTTTGSFAVYLLNNYNVDLTGKTISANMSWTAGKYETRSTKFPGAYVRLEFQDVTAGRYDSNDYWWYTGSLDLNAVSSGTLTGDLKDRSQWTNICGQSAIDPTAQPGPNCVGGTDPDVSPYDGFTKAMKNVKQVGLSFGRASSYASGVAAVDTDQAVFNMRSFTIQ